MTTINKISFGAKPNQKKFELPVLNFPGYARGDEFDYYLKSEEKLEQSKKGKIIKRLWPKLSAKKVRFSSKELEYIEAQQVLSKLKTQTEKSFQKNQFISNIIDIIKKFLFK